MKEYRLDRVEIGLLNPGASRILRFRADGTVESIDPATDRSSPDLFLAGELTTALLPVLLTEEVERGNSSWREAFPPGIAGSSDRLALFSRFQEALERPGALMYVHERNPDRYLRGAQIAGGYDPDRIFLLSLYHSVSGLRPSREASDQSEIRFKLANVPFSHASFSADGLQLLTEYLASIRGRSAPDILRDSLADLRMTDSRILDGKVSVAAPGKAPGLTLVPGEIARAQTAHPAVFGLATSGRDLLRLVRHLALLAGRDSRRTADSGIWGRFVRSPGLGGFSGPFHVGRNCEQLYYEGSGHAGEFRSHILFAADGTGFAILSQGNGEITSLVRAASASVLRHCDIQRKSRTENSQRQSSQTRSDADGEKASGFFRPDDGGPGGLAFLDDVQVEVGPMGGLRMRPLAHPNAILDLAPLDASGLYRIEGNTPMHGWRLRFLSASDAAGDGPVRITGFESDGMSYRRVLLVDSLWGRAALAVLLAMGVLVAGVRWGLHRRRAVG